MRCRSFDDSPAAYDRGRRDGHLDRIFEIDSNREVFEAISQNLRIGEFFFLDVAILHVRDSKRFVADFCLALRRTEKTRCDAYVTHRTASRAGLQVRDRLLSAFRRVCEGCAWIKFSKLGFNA